MVGKSEIETIVEDSTTKVDVSEGGSYNLYDISYPGRKSGHDGPKHPIGGYDTLQEIGKICDYLKERGENVLSVSKYGYLHTGQHTPFGGFVILTEK